MRRRVLLALLVVVVVVTGVGVATVVAVANQVKGSPEDTAQRYLEAWRGSDLTTMRSLVASPPADFTGAHQRFSTDLRVDSIELTPGKIVRTGEEAADLPFTGVREVRGLGPWPFASTLHLAVRDKMWKVIWSPATIHPDLAGNGQIRLTEIPVPAVRLTTRGGEDFPKENDAEGYFSDLNQRIAGVVADPPSGWAIESTAPGRPLRRLVEFRPPPPQRRIRTTIDWFTQAAAARALDGVSQPAAIVAVRPSTGEVLAVADRLLGSQDAFMGRYPPGSTFKVVTAAALLSAGLTADAQQDCPPTYTIPQGRTFRNNETQGHGAVTLRQAFALSCNTTFARLAVERLSGGGLWDQARRLGFGSRLSPGTGAAQCVIQQHPKNGDALGEDAIGQGSVEASPLCMALVAAAVESGTWRPPRLMSENATGKIDGKPGRSMPLPAPVAAALRDMMTAVVTEGTAAAAGLPPGVAGKTGTAEVPGGQPTHAWFIGYRGDLAFCAFVQNGGTGAGAAAPIVARFLKAL
jgi:hypothetical protein